MPRVQIRLRWLMAVVALVAADCVALRVFYVPSYRSALVVMGLLPMLDLLLPGLVLTARQLGRRGSCDAFLAGFEIFGWAAVAAFTGCSLSPSALDTYLAAVILAPPPLARLHWKLRLTYDLDSVVWQVYWMAFSSAALSLPLLITGVFGGCVAWASGVTLARSGRPVETGPGAETVN